METSFKQKVLAVVPNAKQGQLPGFSGPLQRIWIADSCNVYALGFTDEGPIGFLWEKAWNFIQEVMIRKMEA